MLENGNAVTEMKNAFDVLINRLNMSEDRISELEDSSTETTQTKIQRKENEKQQQQQQKTEQTCKNLGTISNGVTLT